MEFRKGDTVFIEGIEYEVINEPGKYPNHIQVRFKEKPLDMEELLPLKKR